MQNTATHIDWLGFHCEVPLDWEISKHGIKPAIGSLTFVDRYQQRMQLGWTKCSKKPDTKRIFDDFIARDTTSFPDAVLEPFFKIKQWQVYRRVMGTAMVTRGGFFDAKNNYWIDCIIMWPHGVDQTLERQIFESISAGNKNQTTVLYKAFHCSFTVNKDWLLTETDIKPADATFTFTYDNSRCVVRRIGMTDAWFDGDEESFLRKEIGAIRGRFFRERHNNHECTLFCGKERVFHPRWMVGQRIVRNDRIMICPSEKSLYHVHSMAYPKRMFDHTDVAIACCQGS